MQNNIQTVEMAQRTGQIIVGALIMGVLTFAMIAASIGTWDPTNFGIMQILGIGMCMGTFPAALIVPKLIVSNMRQTLPKPPNDSVTQDSFAPMFLTSTIIGAALIEGSAFFSLVTYLLEGHFSSLIVALVCLFTLVLFFPMPGRVAEFTQTQHQLWLRSS